MKKLNLFIFLVLSACGGSASDGWVPSKVTFDLSGARALVLNDNAGTVASLTKEGGLMKALTTTEAVTNLTKMLEDGSVVAVIYKESGFTAPAEDATGVSVDVSQVFISPVGDAIITFNPPGVILDNFYCDAVVLNDAGDSYCLDPESSYDEGHIPGYITFDSSGNIYYYNGISHAVDQADYDAIRKWSRSDQITTVLWRPDDINFEGNPELFVIAPDGSVIMADDLEGSSANFFRYYPNTASLEILDDDLLAVASSTVLGRISDFSILDDNKLYVNTSYGHLFRGTFASDGTLSFEYLDTGDFIITTDGYIYADSDDSLSFLEPSVTTLDISSYDTEILEVIGGYTYLTGTDGSANYVFIKKQIADGTETDLLSGQNLLIQHFDVAENGDVYFGALDLDTTTVYLYKYDNATGQLEQLDSLPGDLLDIILL